MTITREQIEMYASAADATQTFGMDKGKLIAVEPEHMQELARMALAGMEAVPGEIKRYDLDMSDCDSCGQDCGADMVEDIDGDYVLWEAVNSYLYQHQTYSAPQPLTTSERAELENYRNAQPDVNYQHLIELYHAQEKRLFKLAQRIKGPAFDKYAHSPSQAIDVLESVVFGESEAACRAAMQGKAEPVTTAYNLPVNTPCKDAPEHIWLQTAGVWPENGEFSELTWCSDNQHQDDTLYVRADVMIGNSPVIPDGWVACSERMPHIGVPVITCCGDVVQYAAYSWDGKEWQDWYEEYDKLPASTFTHWHSRPAAPQQEVKP